MYRIGVTDGHRCAAKIARAALAGFEKPKEPPKKLYQPEVFPGVPDPDP